MNKIPTAEDFFEDWCNRKGYVSIDEADDIEECLREYAIIIKNAALKAAYDEASNSDLNTGQLNKILNSYPDENIQ